MTEKKKVWPDNSSDNAIDWDFQTLRRWMVVRSVEAFIMGGSKELSSAMHGLMTTVLAWGEQNEARRKAEK